jgi:DNA-binding GntR family transcriptional regulator
MKPRTSYEVVQLDDDDINDILDIRELLETFALRTAGSGLKTFPVAELRELFRRPYPPDQYRQFIEADIRLHEAIIGTTKNRKLKKLFDMIYNGIRIIAIPSARVEGRMAESNREHLALLDAIERGDVEEALRQLSHHIQQVKRLMLPNRRQALTGEKN